jgi:hypothetical protein
MFSCSQITFSQYREHVHLSSFLSFYLPFFVNFCLNRTSKLAQNRYVRGNIGSKKIGTKLFSLRIALLKKNRNNWTITEL